MSNEPRPSSSSSGSERSGGEKRPSRTSASHVPAWHKYLHKGVEVPVQNIEESERYLAQIHKDLRAVRSRRDVKADSFTLWFYQTSPFHFLSYRARKKKYN